MKKHVQREAGHQFDDGASAGGPAVDAMIVVDMQVGLLKGSPKHDLQGLLDRINVVQKTLNDPFAGTDLQAIWKRSRRVEF